MVYRHASAFFDEQGCAAPAQGCVSRLDATMPALPRRFSVRSQAPYFYRLLVHQTSALFLSPTRIMSLPDATKSDTRSIYASVPLPPGKFIRVIRIQSGAPPDPIACDFHLLKPGYEYGEIYDFNTDLCVSQQYVQYTALSYTWGDSTPLHTILVDGKPLQVRQNLWDFLQQARERKLTKYLWIDALCIDQEQLNERNHQVWMMGEIYSRAERVIVWFGAVSERVENAMEELCNHRSLWGSSKGAGAGSTELYELAYWSRAWVVQEYVLAREITIWGGTRQMRNPTLTASGSSLWTNLPAIIVIAARHRRISRRDLEFSHSTMLTLLLQVRRDLHCADPRDRIYSLLSLLDPAGPERLAITPDYSVSTSDLFSSVVRLFCTIYEPNRAREIKLAVSILADMLKLDPQDQVVREAQTMVDAYRGRPTQDVKKDAVVNGKEESVS
jgi:hypothetical protein